MHHDLYSEAVVSSIASAVALAEVGRSRETVQYLQKAAKALYEAAKEVFEHVKVTVQRFVELFVEAVTQVLAWVNKHKAYPYLMAAAAAGAVALGVALNLWGLVEMEKLGHAAMGAPFFVGLADVGEKAAERFRSLAERYERWKIDANVIDEIISAPLKGERPYAAFLKLAAGRGLPPPLVELRKALARVEGEAERDAAVVAALVLYKALVKNAEAYREWAELYRWARGLVEKQEFTVAASDIKRLRGAHRRLEEVAEQVRRELNAVLTLYKSHSRDLYERLRPHLEVDVKKAEELAKARNKELSKYSDVNMGTKAYAALLSVARGGIYGHAAMLLMGEGALADIVLSTPATTHWKAWNIATMRGEVVDPSRSHMKAEVGEIAKICGGVVDLLRVEAAGWEDRAASVLLRFLVGYSEIDPQLLSGAGEMNLKFRLVEKGGKRDDEKKRVVKGVERGFQVFRAHGGVEAPVSELWIGKTAAYFKVSKEGLRRLVEEAKETAPDLSGFDKAPQYLEWRATDVTTVKRQIEVSTVHSWQLRWYFGLLGGPKWFSGGADVTKEGIKFLITAYWPRKSEDQILKESRWLKSLLGRTANNWRELVDAINWSWVLEKVGKMVETLKPWVGPERTSDMEREGLVRRMLGELALLVHFAEARRGMDDGKWREERTKRLAKAVEALSSGRIKGDHANELAKLIISYAESREERTKKRIENLAEKVGVSKEEVWGVVDFILSDMYCLARDCARDEVVRKFVAPALELVMLDKALSGKFDREEALLRFGEMYATAVAGDGHVERRSVELAVGGELGGGAALLRLATLQLLNRLLPDKLKFNARAYMGKGVYNITATGENAAGLMRLLAVSAPSAGGEHLSEKFNEFVKEARVEVRFDNIRLTKKGLVATDLIISEAGVAVKYNIYLRKTDIMLLFHSTDQSRVELAARLLKLAGVDAEVTKVGNRNVWQVVATTDMLAAGRKEFRDALAEIIKTALAKGWVNAGKAERWLEKLKSGVTLKEGWPKYEVGLSGGGALVVRYETTNPDSIEREEQRLRDMGLKEGVHFTVKRPEGGEGYVSILKEGLAYAAWLSVHGEEEQQRLAAEFVEYILRRAWEAGKKVYEKAQKVVDEGKARGSLTLKGFEKKVEVGGREHVVKVIGWSAKTEESQSGKLLLRIRITAEVDDIRGEYEVTYGRYGKLNAALGFAVPRADAPGGREADAERLAALIKALTGKEPGIHKSSNGKIDVACGREHLEGFRRYAELADVIEKWLEETSRR
jgi:hypothetical protein